MTKKEVKQLKKYINAFNAFHRHNMKSMFILYNVDYIILYLFSNGKAHVFTISLKKSIKKVFNKITEIVYVYGEK